MGIGELGAYVALISLLQQIVFFIGIEFHLGFLCLCSWLWTPRKGGSVAVKSAVSTNRMKRAQRDRESYNHLTWASKYICNPTYYSVLFFRT